MKDETYNPTICIRCGEEIEIEEGIGRRSRMFCAECLPLHQKELERIRADNARTASGKERLNRCVRCEGPRERSGSYCRDCKRLHEQEEQRRKERTMDPYDRELLKQVLPQRVVQEPNFSAQFTGDEIDRMAKEHHTSYGKFRAWIDCRKRLPRPGERMF